MKTIILNPINNRNLDNIVSMFDEYNVFYFKQGNYYLSDQLNIIQDNISFIGMTDNANDIHIFQTNSTKNGLNIKGDNFIMTDISLHVDEAIALTVANSNWSIVEHCHFYGSNNTFTVFYAGKDYNDNIFNEFNNNNMDSNNYFNFNIIYSKWSGDCVSFSLQYNGSVRNNILRGGKIAIYMCSNCIVSNNKVYDSASHGIICSLPSKNINIINNLIRDCTDAAIGVKMQTEHGPYYEKKQQIMIIGNTINDTKSIGIEINDGDDIKIKNNKLFWTSTTGIYLLNSDTCNVENNTVSHFDIGILLDINCKNNNISLNKLYSVYPDASKHCIFVENDTENNVITNNHASGICTSDKIKVLGINTNTNNAEQDYHTYGEESAMIY